MSVIPAESKLDDVGRTPGSLTGAPSICSSEASDFDSIRRVKRCSVASQVTFAGLFGDADSEEDPEDASTEPGFDDRDSITLITRQPRRGAYALEYILLLYLLTSTMSRVNLKQWFRLRQCLTILHLNASQCGELFKLEDVKTDDIKKASDSLIDARLGVEYAAGTVVVFFLSQYLVKYGLRHALFLCLIGSLLAHISICATFFFVTADAVHTFLASIPLVLSGGEILMLTITCTHIGTETVGSARRERFLLFQFCSLFPAALNQLLDVEVLPLDIKISRIRVELYAMALLALTIVISLCYTGRYAEEFESHSIKQRIRCSFGFVSFKETVMCFSKERQCRGRAQLVLLICILSTAPFYLNFFSAMQAGYMSKIFNWDSEYFARAALVTVVLSCVICLLSSRINTKWIRALDPTVAAVSFSCLALSFTCLLFTVFTQIIYYGSLTFMAVSALAMPYLLSHACQLLEKSEIAPVFALICALERISHIVAIRLWKLILERDQSQLTFVIVFAGQLGYVVLLVIGCLIMVSMTRSHGYPSHFFNPSIGSV